MPTFSTGIITHAFGTVVCISFALCAFLLSHSIYAYCKKKNQITTVSHTPWGLSLISMSLFTTSLFLYSVHFIMFAIRGTEIPGFDLLNNLCYVIAIFTTLYVWIQRLDDTFHNSAHGYSSKYIRNLRILFFGTIIFTVLLMVQHILIANHLGLTRMISFFGGVIFAFLFISLFVTVLCSFLYKMTQSIKLLEEASHNRAHQTHKIGKKLVALVVKFTILSVLCIGSTLCAQLLVLAMLFDGNAVWPSEQFPVAVDCSIGFVSLYCAWSSNKKVYYKLFGCVHSVMLKYSEESSTHPDAVHGDSPRLGPRDIAFSVSVQSQAEPHLPRVASNTLRSNTVMSDTAMSDSNGCSPPPASPARLVVHFCDILYF
eukprot:471988_1